MLISPFIEQAENHPDRTFIYWQSNEITYGDALRQVGVLAAVMRSSGIEPGDRVGLLCDNRPEFIFGWFATSLLGAVAVPLNTKLNARQQTYILEQSQVKLLLHNEESSTNGAGASLALEPALRDPVSQGIVSSPTELDNEAAMIIYTSGTTGPPKGVVLSHKSYSAAGQLLASILALTSNDRIMVSLPLFHANPQIYAVMSSIRVGASLIILPRFSATSFWEDARSFGATGFTYVGSVLAILEKKWGPLSDPPGIRFCVGGGAPLHAWEWLEDRLKVKVHELYGMTETGGFATINTDAETRRGSCGKARPDMDVAIADERDNLLETSQVGEIVLRPREPGVLFDHYNDMPDATVDAFRNLWFHTGDLGRLDEDGYLFFCGRTKHIIRRGGENISPKAIEEAAQRFAEVLDAAVVGVPDDVLEEEIKIVVVPGEGFDLAAFLKHLRSELPAFMMPRYVEQAHALPKTETEKVKVEELRASGDGMVDLRPTGNS